MSDMFTNLTFALRAKMDMGARLTPGEIAMAQDHGLMNDSSPPKDPGDIRRQGFGWLVDPDLAA